MAMYVKKSNPAVTFILVVFVLAIMIAAGVFVYSLLNRYYDQPGQPVTQGDIADLEARLAQAEAQLDLVEGNARAEFWWTVAKWVLVIGAGTFCVWYFLKRYFDRKSDRLTIDEGLALGEKELAAKFGFTTRFKYGKSLQRREGSDDRILLLVFSRFPLLPGLSGLQSGLLYIAVVNRSWEERYVSEPGMSYLQFMQHLRDLEVIGFSVQKDEEMAGLLKLKEKAEALNNAGNLAADLGIGGAE